MTGTDEAEAPARLALADGATLAYRRRPGKGPGVVFVSGWRSDMGGTKATALDAWAAARGQAYLRYDHFGHGRSSGPFEAGTIGRWAADLAVALDRLTEGPQVLVGSSMGGWLALLAALARPDRVAGLALIAPAPDFTEELMRPALTPAQQATLARGEIVREPSPYGFETVIAPDLLAEARDHLLLGGPIALACPVRILHGQADTDVPWTISLRLAERLTTPDLVLTLVKDGDHRLSRPEDLARLAACVGELAGG